MHRRLPSLVAATTLLVLAGGLPARADEFTTPPDSVGDVVGMAWDDRSDRLWVAGDEASEGVLIGLDDDGQQSLISWKADDLQSVEALAIHDGMMYVGDTGNGDGERDEFTVYRFSNLDPGSKKYRAWVFDHPAPGDEDIQTLLVSGKGRMYFVSQGTNPGIYRAPTKPSREGTNELTRVADAPAGVTDGTFLPDGGTVVLRAADGVHVLDAYTWETQAIETYASDPGPESVTALDDDTVLLGGSAAIREAAVPTSNTTTTPPPAANPSPSPSPSPAPSPSPTGEADGPDAQDPPTPTPRNTGTMIALTLAGLVALGAGVVTYLVKD